MEDKEDLKERLEVVSTEIEQLQMALEDESLDDEASCLLEEEYHILSMLEMNLIRQISYQEETNDEQN